MLKFLRLFKPMLLLLFGVCSVSCSKSSDDGSGAQSVSFSADLSTRSEIKYPGSGSGIDLSQLPFPSDADFAVSITKGGNVKAAYDSFSQMPSDLELEVGVYNFKASYGEPFGGAWNRSYYEGNKEFSVTKSQSKLNLNLECKLETAFAFMRFDDLFLSTFENVSVSLSTEHTSEPMVFAVGETRIACFRPATKLVVMAHVTLRSTGKQYVYGVDPVMDFKAGEMHVMNFTVKGSDVSFDMTIDNGVTVVKKEVALDPDWLATRKTKLTTSYDDQLRIDNIYGLPYTKATDVVATSNVGVKSFYLKFDAGFATQVGIDSINMLNMTDAERRIVDQLGIVLSSNEDNMGHRANLTRCVNKLKMRGGVKTDYDFVIGVTDMVDNGATKHLKLQIAPPEFKREDQQEGKVWNRFAYVPHAQVANVSDEDKARFPIEYWISTDRVTWRSLGVIASATDIYVNELLPNTKYYTKASFEDIEMNESSFTTSGETAIENGDFENYTVWDYDGRGERKGVDLGGQWATLNDYTTMNRTNNMYFRSYPCVRVVSGRSGKGIELVTTGWGAGSTYKSEKKFLQSPWFHSQYCERATAGKVYLGTYTYDGASEEAGQVHGRNFASRPSALSFWSKYKVVNGNSMVVHAELLAGTEVVGSGEYTDNQNVSEFTKHIIPIRYSVTGIAKPVTSIRLYLSSQITSATSTDIENVNGSAQASATFGETIDAWDSRFQGSVLTVDDVELMYPTEYSDFTIQ